MRKKFIATDASPTLAPVRPSAAIDAKYRARLDREIAEMQNSIVYWISAKYRANRPEIAQDAALGMDASPAAVLAEAMRKLGRRWQRKFDALAPKLAAHFAQSVEDRSDRALKSTLRDHGFTVRFRKSRTQNDVFQSIVQENVNLIKSIPQQYLKAVEGHVMRSVQAGRDLQYLTDKLESTYGVTRRRAEFIARDQNAKATAALTRARHQELGITQAKWMHSAAGKEPRPTHLANNGNLYDVRKGWFDPAVSEWVFPGELPNCRCFAVAVVPGFDA